MLGFTEHGIPLNDSFTTNLSRACERIRDAQWDLEDEDVSDEEILTDEEEYQPPSGSQMPSRGTKRRTTKRRDTVLPRSASTATPQPRSAQHPATCSMLSGAPKHLTEEHDRLVEKKKELSGRI